MLGWSRAARICRSARKRAQDDVGVHAAADQLDRDALLDTRRRRARPGRPSPMPPWPSSPQRLGRARCAGRARGRPASLGSCSHGRLVEEPAGVVVPRQQRLDLARAASRSPAHARLQERRRARPAARSRAASKSLPDALPALGAFIARPSSRWSQARASAQSRLTVAGETSTSTSAVSSMVRPPKKRSSTTLRLPRVERGQARPARRRARAVEVLALAAGDQRVVDRRPAACAAAPLGRAAPARVVDQDAAHQLRGDGEEVRAALPGAPPAGPRAAGRPRGRGRWAAACGPAARGAGGCRRAGAARRRRAGAALQRLLRRPRPIAGAVR